MLSRRQVVELCALCALAPSAAPAAAQQESRSATIPVILRILARTTFDGGMFPAAAADAWPAGSGSEEPTTSVHTRVGFDVTTRVVVTGSPLLGPAGLIMPARLDCAFEGSASGNRSNAFDCAAGLLARVGETWTRAGSGANPVVVVAAVRALNTVSATRGRYTGRVVVSAISPAY